ncbi:MAG: neprosin family prolyl endopeptidase [Anaerolineales bacterium]|nr:neprosin family prolyl endopeptidase [Anaerolineales bacterium]
MDYRKIAYLLVLLIFLAGCTGTTPTPTPEPDQFIPLDEYLAVVETATFDEYVELEQAQVENEDAFAAMKEHILTMYEGVESLHSFVSDNQYIDCIRIEDQPGVRLRDLTIDDIDLAGPDLTNSGEFSGKDPDAGEAEFVPSPLTLGEADAFGNKIACEDGTIPMRRITLEEMVRFPNLERFFSKSADGNDRLPPIPPEKEPQDPEDDRPSRQYAYGWQAVTNYGGNSWLNLWNPNVSNSSDFSLSQHWYTAGEDDEHQTVEGGWQVYENKYGSDNAALFIFYTADNYQSANKKCYNLECSAFVQINSNWVLGGTWSNYSTTGGTQWIFGMQWKLYEDNWWLFLRGAGDYEAVGYYPASAFDDGPITESATMILYGGEVTPLDVGWPEMGSGEFAEQGWQRAAYQRTIFYIPRNENNGVGVWADLNPVETAPDCFTIDYTDAADGGSWGTYFFFGGPGGDCE